MKHLKRFYESFSDKVNYLEDIFQEKIDEDFSININKFLHLTKNDYINTWHPSQVEINNKNEYLDIYIIDIVDTTPFKVNIFLDEISRSIEYMYEFKYSCDIYCNYNGPEILTLDQIKKTNNSFIDVKLVFFKNKKII